MASKNLKAANNPVSLMDVAPEIKNNRTSKKFHPSVFVLKFGIFPLTNICKLTLIKHNKIHISLAEKLIGNILNLSTNGIVNIIR